MVVMATVHPAAAGGGAVWNADKQFYRPGERARLATSVQWGYSRRAGTPADGPYYAYLVPAGYAWDAGFWAVRKDGASIGTIRITKVDRLSRVARATIDFAVPEVAAGDYEVRHCNRPCTKTFGDITWGTVRVVESAVEGRAWMRLERTAGRIERRAERGDRSLSQRIRRSARDGERRVADLETEVTEQIDALEAEVASLRAAASRARPERGSPAVGWLVAFCVGALAASALARLRHRVQDSNAFGRQREHGSDEVGRGGGEQDGPLVVVSRGTIGERNGDLVAREVASNGDRSPLHQEPSRGIVEPALDEVESPVGQVGKRAAERDQAAVPFEDVGVRRT